MLYFLWNIIYLAISCHEGWAIESIWTQNTMEPFLDKTGRNFVVIYWVSWTCHMLLLWYQRQIVRLQQSYYRNLNWNESENWQWKKTFMLKVHIRTHRIFEFKTFISTFCSCVLYLYVATSFWHAILGNYKNKLQSQARNNCKSQ